MAKVLGESGRYTIQETIRRQRRIALTLMLTVMVLSGIAGYVLCLPARTANFPLWLSWAIPLFLLLLFALFWKLADRKLNELEKRRMDVFRGAIGETLVGRVLADFPDEFYVINDLTTPFGNVDHVVVGPTGVFVLDTKTWRGMVSADGKGELLLNGQPTDKPFVRQFVSRMLGIRDKVRLLASGLDPFYQAVFVFTSARVDANWGTTGNVHCVRDDQLFDYIVEKDFGKRLKKEEVEQIAQAFLGLARMDRDFSTDPPASSLPGVATSPR